MPKINNNLKSNWGGSRNFGSRESNYLSKSQCKSILSAALKSVEIGFPLNRFITINWALLGVPANMGSKVTCRLLKLARDFYRKRGHKFYWAYVREADFDGSNHHLHLLIHVPNQFSIIVLRWFRRWLSDAMGLKYCGGGIETRRIGGRSDCFDRNPDHFILNLKTVTEYILKSSGPNSFRALGLRLYGQKCKVIGKRSGRSNNLA